MSAVHVSDYVARTEKGEQEIFVGDEGTLPPPPLLSSLFLSFFFTRSILLKNTNTTRLNSRANYRFLLPRRNILKTLTIIEHASDKFDEKHEVKRRENRLVSLFINLSLIVWTNFDNSWKKGGVDDDENLETRTWKWLTRPVPRGANDISKTVSGEIEAVTGPLIAGVNIYSR